MFKNRCHLSPQISDIGIQVLLDSFPVHNFDQRKKGYKPPQCGDQSEGFNANNFSKTNFQRNFQLRVEINLSVPQEGSQLNPSKDL